MTPRLNIFSLLLWLLVVASFGRTGQTAAIGLMNGPDGAWSSAAGAALASQMFGSWATVTEIVLSTNAVDFGAVMLGLSADRMLELRHTGNAPLIVAAKITNGMSFSILEMVTSNLTTYILATNQIAFSIPAGGRRELTLRFAPLSTGTKTGVLEIVSSGADQRSLTVKLKGDGVGSWGPPPVPRIAVWPSALDFGDVSVSQQSQRTLLVLNEGDADLSVSQITDSSPDFDVVSPAGGLVLRPGSSATVLVRFTPKSIGLQTGTLTVPSNDPARPVVFVRMSGNGIQPIIEVSPLSLDFGEVEYGKSAERRCVIKNKGNTDLTVRAMESDDLDFELMSAAPPFVVSAEGQQEVTLSFRPNQAGLHTASFSILSDDPLSATVIVALKGAGFFPAIQITPRILEFGSVTVGQSRDLSIAIGNWGPAPLIIQSVGIEADQYQVVAPKIPFTVSPQGEQAAQIRFTPCWEGRQTGTLFFRSNDPDTPSVGVVANGAGSGATEPTVVINASDSGRVVVQDPSGIWQTNDFHVEVSATFKPRQPIKVNEIWQSQSATGVVQVRFWGVASEVMGAPTTFEYDIRQNYALTNKPMVFEFSPRDADLLYARVDLPHGGSCGAHCARILGLDYDEAKGISLRADVGWWWWFPYAYPVRGTACVSGFQSEFIAQVLDAETQQPISGAEVQLGPSWQLTDSSGIVRFTSVSAGRYGVAVRKPGYNPVSSSVSLPPLGKVSEVFSLTRLGEINVVSIDSKYRGFRYYLDTVSFPVAFKAQVDWGGHRPGKVIFITPKKTFEVVTTSDVAHQTLDMGKDFGPNGALKVVAVSKDGVRSPAREAELVVMPAIQGANFIQKNDSVKGDFFFKSSGVINWKFINQYLPPGIIPENIPIVGGRPYLVRCIPNMEIKLRDNHVDYLLLFEGANLSKCVVAGIEIEAVPFGKINGNYMRGQNRWQWEGGIGCRARAKALSTPIPWGAFYVRFSVEPEGELYFHTPVPISDVALNPDRLPFRWIHVDGKWALAIGGALGLGEPEILAGELWIKGGIQSEFEFLQEPRWKDVHVFVEAELKEYFLLFKYIQVIGRKEWRLMGGGRSLSGLPLNSQSATFTPLDRDYLGLSDYGRFVKSNRATVKAQPSSLRASSFPITPLQFNVFPYSDANVGAAVTNLNLAGLYDDPSRTAENRTVAVFSRFDGVTWTDPVPIADDGTADFHPKLLGFQDGSALAAWEDEQRAFGPGVTVGDMAANLEISAAWFDQAARKWLPARRLTSNQHLDRTPKVSGKSPDNVLMVWVANEANDIFGGAEKPNKLLFCRWNGNAWTAPREIAAIAYPTLKYDLGYDGATAHVVLCLDTDQNPDTVEDHELFRLIFANGQWGALERLTADTVPDDNPTLAIDSISRFVLVWLKADGITSAVNFQVGKRQIILANAYSSHLAEFKLANSPDGRLALVWIEPGEFSSDLWTMFFDPIFQAWGKPRQLTADPETEKWVAASFLGPDTLVAVYNRTPRRTTLVATNNTTDLCLVRYRLEQDPALKPDSFEAQPPNPGSGESVILKAIVENLGALPVVNLSLAFYLGNPAQGGLQMGRANLSQPLVSGDAADVSLTWVVTGASAPIHVFAVVDPERKTADANRSNNSASLVLARADLAIQSITWSKISSNHVAIVTTIVNQGAIQSSMASLVFRQGAEDGPVLFTKAIPALAKSGQADVEFDWDVSGLSQDLLVFASIDIGGSGNDFLPNNNQARLSIQRAGPAIRWELGSPLLLPNGTFQLSVMGEFGRGFAVEASTNLLDWTPLATFLSTNLVTDVLDTNALDFPRRFYRAIVP
jgi:hypothetical protein